jgi:hypothetical protein
MITKTAKVWLSQQLLIVVRYMILEQKVSYVQVTWNSEFIDLKPGFISYYCG